VHRSRDGSRQAGAPRRVETPTDGASVGEKQLKRLFASAAAGVALPGVAAPPTPPVTDAMLRRPADSDWLMWRGGFASWGYSPLTQITSANVRTLKLAWSRGMSAGSNQGMPLVHAGVMYLPNPTDVIQALDAATGDLFWEHRRQWPDDIAKTFPTPTPNRSLALYGDKVIAASADDFIYALDAKTGKQAWETQFLDYHKNAAQKTAGPLVITGGKIIGGRGCEPKGGPDACVITAHDAATGKELWRTRTIPRPGEPGDESWGGVPMELRRHVGTWMPPSYDPELNLIYIGTSVTSPAPKFLLGGNDKKYLYHNSTLALDANTGKIVWYYQHVVDHWDMDHPFERILLDTVVAPDPKSVSWINPKLKPGERRKVVTGIPGKTGIVYTLDRKTGEFLWATPTVKQNIVQKIDGATGEVTVNPATLMSKTGDTVHVCPNSNGGKNWPGGAYSPLTGMMYFPLQNTCMDVTAVIDKPTLASLYGTRSVSTVEGDPSQLGTVQAISATTGKIAWKYAQRAATLSLVATGGGLIFGGDFNGHAFALDQRTGKKVWEVNLGSPVTGYPISYSVKGKQYVAYSTGSNSPLSALIRMTPELHPSVGNTVYVFALP
jgi:PQQ-dependent dehydrogenase (methanol/ethanol family)